MRICRHKGVAWEDESFVERQMGADAAVDIIDFDSLFSGEHTAELLVFRVFLVAASRVAVEGEERVLWIVYREVVLFKVFDDVCPAEISGDAYVDGHIEYLVDLCGGVRMRLENFLDDGFSHTPKLPKIFFYFSVVIAHHVRL